MKQGQRVQCQPPNLPTPREETSMGMQPVWLQIRAHLARESSTLYTWDKFQKKKKKKEERREEISLITLSMAHNWVEGFPWMAWITTIESPSNKTEGNPTSSNLRVAKEAARAYTTRWIVEDKLTQATIHKSKRVEWWWATSPLTVHN